MNEFKCPYCFNKMKDNDILFRLNDESILEQVQKKYAEHHKKLNAGEIPLDQASFSKKAFLQAQDDILINFWGSFEKAPKEAKNPVLDPRDPEVQAFLVKSPEGKFVHRVNGFPDFIQLSSEVSAKSFVVRDRICCHCHNALPDGYGKYKTDIISVIGITGSGKTVYLSKLLEQLKSQLIFWGISSLPTSSSAKFIRKNPVEKDIPLPESTPYDLKQDPIYYELLYTVHGRREGRGLLIYDIAGENFSADNISAIRNYGRNIQESDGFILLLDPLQFPQIAGQQGQQDGKKDHALQAIKAIQNIIASNGIVRKPVAVCISKVDMPIVQSLFMNNQAIMNKLNQDCSSTMGPGGTYDSVFPSADYNVISKGMVPIIKNQDASLHQELLNSYSRFNYFALTSLGCEVENGRPVSYVNPRRIIEPVLWLFRHFGYLREDSEIYSPAMKECPSCGGLNTLSQEGQKEISRGFLSFMDDKIKGTPLRKFGIQKVDTTMYCRACKDSW